MKLGPLHVLGIYAINKIAKAGEEDRLINEEAKRRVKHLPRDQQAAAINKLCYKKASREELLKAGREWDYEHEGPIPNGPAGCIVLPIWIAGLIMMALFWIGVYELFWHCVAIWNAAGMEP
jgi:hypothetical protein